MTDTTHDDHDEDFSDVEPCGEGMCHCYCPDNAHPCGCDCPRDDEGQRIHL
ncbi:hypothetical protein [Streptomyces monomycini]|uniref:hypothetical protein n=1 Tax=Streptomyces monomycini TaxID=371720 RepID=UPI000B216E6F|nr:hypothetical protein [Streptomyces monomycini]